MQNNAEKINICNITRDLWEKQDKLRHYFVLINFCMLAPSEFKLKFQRKMSPINEIVSSSKMQDLFIVTEAWKCKWSEVFDQFDSKYSV